LNASTIDSPEARRRAIELLEANHVFPGSFSLSVIARTDDAVEAAVLAAAAAAVGLDGPLAKDAHERRPSAHGKYVSHRLRVPCASAEAVLALYARLRAVDGVITIL
jgi:putative lipoic acid-binding regulatory protein